GVGWSRARRYLPPSERDVSRTVVPRRPSVATTPDRDSRPQAAETVVGESASSRATARIGGSLVPGFSAPSATALLTAVARARDVGSSRRSSSADSTARTLCNITFRALCHAPAYLG